MMAAAEGADNDADVAMVFDFTWIPISGVNL